MHQLENKIIYQIYPKSFKDTSGNGFGDINGIIEKLDYLKNLGVDYLWLSPCCKSPQKDNGYDIADYRQIDPLFGTNEDYLRLIKEAKKRNMKVMMDLVLNHTSDQHIWFKKACQRDPQYFDYYIWRQTPNDLSSYFSESAWTYNKEIGMYYFHLFDVSQPDLNWDNPKVRQELYDMVNYWIKQGVEGFRLDVIDVIGKVPDLKITSKGPKFYEYLQELNENTFKDQLLTVGECWGSTLEESNKMCNEKGLTQAFHFNHLTTTQVNNDKFKQTPLNLDKVCEILNNWQNNYTGIEAMVMNNHDLPRLVSLWLDDNQYRIPSAKLLITLFGITKGNLYIYQGEEIGMTNAHRHDLAFYNDVETLNKYRMLKQEGYTHEKIMEMISLISRDNARTPMQWDNSKNSGFTQGKPWLEVNSNYLTINVENDLNNPEGVYAYYQKIIEFRKKHYDLINQPSNYSHHDGVVEVKRGNLRIYANFTNENKMIQEYGEIQMKNYQIHDFNTLKPYEVIFTKVK
ncbi:MAG: alpha-glucosidase [Beduini sp.]